MSLDDAGGFSPVGGVWLESWLSGYCDSGYEGSSVVGGGVEFCGAGC